MPASPAKKRTAGAKVPHRANHYEARDGSPRASASTTVAKAIGILDILASKADVGISLAELSSLIDIPKSSTHRYLVTLQELGLAQRKDGDRFCLGTKVIELAGSFLVKSDLRNESQAVLNELAEKTGETIHLAVPSGTEVVYIAKVESKHALGMFSHIGARLPMYCTALGKAILAYSDEELLHAVLAQPLKLRTPNSITSEKALEADLTLIHSRGYAIDNEENEIGIRCVGAPIFDYSATPIAAISISVPRERMDQERCTLLGPMVSEAAQMVSRRKGFSGQLPDALDEVHRVRTFRNSSHQNLIEPLTEKEYENAHSSSRSSEHYAASKSVQGSWDKKGV
jgi:DNA-binding IclR family transcriptional regulator